MRRLRRRTPAPRVRASQSPLRRRTSLSFESLEHRWMLAADLVAALDLGAGSAAEALPALNGTAEIRGTKWSDLNGDGGRNDNEPGLAGVTIYLDLNNDEVLGEDEPQTLTAADNPETLEDETGTYAFTELMPGTYIVREVVPTGYEQTFPLARESEFEITVVFPDDSLSAEQQEFFIAAAARWSELILGDLPDVNVPGHGLVDDLLIEATGPTIDGPGGILGQAGPDTFRSGSFLPSSGVMQFDQADIVDLIDEGQFDEVILHEMGHVLGIGTIWDNLGLLTGFGSTNPQFIGPQATIEYNAIFGNTTSSVPVEGDQGGGGTLYSHWDEATFDNELMTGFLNGGEPNPISRITVGQMADIGYDVNLNAADEYTAPNLRATSEDAVEKAPLGRIEILRFDPIILEPLPAAQAATLPSLAEPNVTFWTVELADGEIVEGVDFGNMPLPGSISGIKWNDRDADGVRDESEPAIAGWTIFLDEDLDGEFDRSEETYESDDLPKDINDLQTTTSVIDVEGLFGDVLDVNVTIDVTHSFDADLDIFLVSPSGTRIALATNIGGSGNNFSITTFDDEADISIAASTAPFNGTFRPERLLATLDGQNPNGEWKLEIVDEAFLDEGIFRAWSLTIQAGERFTTTNADGEYQFLNLPAGAYRVDEVQQDDYVQTFPRDPGHYDVTLVPGEERVGVDFGNRNGYIGGTLWNDYNGNGVREESEPPLVGWTVYLDQNNNGVLDDGPTTIGSSDGPANIPDQGTIESQITVANLAVIGDVDVTINIDHPYDSDLDVFLVSPSGTRVELLSDVGTFGDNFEGTTLDDEAGAAITSGTAPFSGRFRPEGLLSTFDGENPNGIWTLEVSDDTFADVGSLIGWSLTISTRETTAVTDADGAYAFEDLRAATYYVTEIVEAGWVQTLPPAPGRYEIALAAGEARFEVDFANRAGALRGLKWNDRNSNGTREEGEPGLPGWTIYLDENNNGLFDDGAVTIESTGDPAAIPDLGKLSSTILVSGQQEIDDLNVSLAIAHTYIADLDVYLISPSGTRVELFTDLAAPGQSFDGTTLDDEASQLLSTGVGPFTGTYRPFGSLADFDGQDPNGIWTLEVSDDAGNDFGTLKGWSLAITSHETFTTTGGDGAYEFLNVLPASYVVREVNQANWQPTFPAAPGGHAFAIAAGEQRGALDFGARATALFGDYDRDGDVDGNDFLFWQQNLGKVAEPVGSSADGNNNGTVDGGDLAIWDQGFGGILAASPASVTAPAFDEAIAQFDAMALAGLGSPARNGASLAAPCGYEPTRPADVASPRADALTPAVPLSGFPKREAPARRPAFTAGGSDGWDRVADAVLAAALDEI
jgi:subtilisin-like proprotein convertase family protein